MATSELDISITYVDNVEEENPSTIDDSEAIRQPSRLKRLQKKSRVVEEDDDNNGEFFASEPVEEPSLSHEDSGKKSKDKKQLLDELRRMQIANDEEEALEYTEYTEEGDNGETEKHGRRKKRGGKKKSIKDDDNFFLEEIAEKKQKAKAKVEKKEKKTTQETLAELNQAEGLYTLEEEDEPRRRADSDEDDRREIEEKVLLKLESMGRERAERNTKKTGRSQSIKTRNKLFGDINPQDFLNGTEQEPSYFETYIEEEIQIAKPERKKDLNRLLTNVDRYKTEKIRVPLQKSYSTMNSTPSTIATTQPSQLSDIPLTESLPHANSAPPGTIGTIASQPSETSSIAGQELERMDSTKTVNASSSSRGASKAIDIKSMISHSKTSISLDDNRLLEVEVAVPHLNKAGSQTIADNTLFINYLARQQSFKAQGSIKAQVDNGARKNDLKSLTAKLAEQHKAKKSANITLEMINARFQKTDLRDLEAKNKKEGQDKTELENVEEKPNENEEKDSDYNPDELERIEGENEFTFQGPLENDGRELAKPVEKKVLEIDDIRRLEEGEEDEGEDGVREYDEEGEEGDEEEKEGDLVDDEAEEEVGQEEESEDERKNKKKKGRKGEDEEDGKEKYIDKFADLDVYFNDVQGEVENREGAEDGERKFRKLKRIKEQILDSIKKKEKSRQEREIKRQQAQERRKQMIGYMDLEAELGSDQEENDDMIRTIDKRDEGENEDGLDEDLEELIDHAYQEIGENDEIAFNHFFSDLLHQDRENIKKVIQRSFTNKRKRKRDEFDIDVDGDERELKKMKRMQEIIQQLEESENVFLNFGDNNGNGKAQAQEENDIFDDSHANKHVELIRVKNQMKKMLKKQNSFDTAPKDLFITTDLEVMEVLQKNNGDRRKGTEFGRQEIKLGTSMIRQKTITKNSILNTKDNPKNINQLNNNINKDIMNEYGSREEKYAAVERQISMKAAGQPNIPKNNNQLPDPKGKTVNKGGVQTSTAPMSNLNKLFSVNSNEIKSTSPNKVFIFKYRNKK